MSIGSQGQEGVEFDFPEIPSGTRASAWDMNGKKLLILTGATGGIGSPLLDAIKNKDYAICCLGRREPDAGDGIAHIQADFASRDLAYISKLRQWICERHNISEIVLVLAASTVLPIEGIGSLGEGAVVSIGTNVTSQVMTIDTVVNLSKEKKCGIRIIQFDSGAAYRPINGWALYCSAKAYMGMFLKVLAQENEGCRVVLFDPGVVDTGMQLEIRGSASGVFSDRPAFIGYKERGQLNDPKKVAMYVVDRYIDSWVAENINERYVAGD